MKCCLNYYYHLFLSGFSFTDTDDSQDSRGREATIFYSTLPLPPAHEHSDTYLQLCMWDDYQIFLISRLVFTRLLLNEILPPYQITIWLIDDVKFVLVCLIDDLILRFCYNNLDSGNRWNYLEKNTGCFNKNGGARKIMLSWLNLERTCTKLIQFLKFCLKFK